MRINSIPSKELLSQYIHVRRNENIVPKQPSSSDKVELTEEARNFSTALQIAKGAIAPRTPEKAARIQEVAEQIQNRTYYVPGKLVAEKILGQLDK